MYYLNAAITLRSYLFAVVSRTTRFFSWMLALSLVCTLANAQQSEPRPTVTRATDLVLEYPSRVPLGTDVIFMRRASVNGSALIQAGVQVRVFTLDEGLNRPKPFNTVGDCEVFLTVVHNLTSPSGGLGFAKLNQDWINLSNSGNSTKDTKWFLVFEQLGAKHQQFRIKATDASAYFATGFAVTVFDNGSIPFPVIASAYESRKGRTAKLYEEIDNKNQAVPCYSYRQVSASLETPDLLAYGNVERCKIMPADVDAM